MLTNRTHFEQVPLKMVKKIAAAEIRRLGMPAQVRAIDSWKQDKKKPGGEKLMCHTFDIFQEEACGGVLWLESAATLEDAKARVHALSKHSPVRGYLLLNQKTGDKLVM